MTSGEAPSGPSGTKVAGIALIGVGLLAGVFAVATAVSAGPDQAALPPPNGSQSQPPPDSDGTRPPETEESGTPPPRSTSPPPPTTPPGSETNSKPPPDPNHGKDPGKGQGTNHVVVRVYNNSTIKGLAHDAAADFRRAGFEVAKVGNYSAGRIYTTTVYFRPGTGEEAQARKVAERFDARLEPRFKGLDAATPGVIAIITNDYKAQGAGK